MYKIDSSASNSVHHSNAKEEKGHIVAVASGYWALDGRGELNCFDAYTLCYEISVKVERAKPSSLAIIGDLDSNNVMLGNFELTSLDSLPFTIRIFRPTDTLEVEAMHLTKTDQPGLSHTVYQQ